MQEHYIGDEITAKLESHLSQSSKVFLVRGKKSYYSCGAASLLGPLFERHGNDVTEYFDFSVNPKEEDVIKGCETLREAGADLIMGVGGGSVIDMSKLIRHKNQELNGIRIPLVAMPTTAGSGAEATHFAVEYVNGVKQSVSADDIIPDSALIYPPFTFSANAYLTACAGFDAIAHAIESYWSVKSTKESRQFSEQALKNLWFQIPELLNNLDNKDLRESVAKGAYYAGRAINLTTTTAPHAFSYKFTSNHNMPHAHAVAMTFPYFWAVNCSGKNLNAELMPQEYKSRIGRLKELLGCSEGAEKGMIRFFEEYLTKIGLEKKSFNKADIDAVVNGFNRQRAVNNPVIIDVQNEDCVRNYLERIIC